MEDGRKVLDFDKAEEWLPEIAKEFKSYLGNNLNAFLEYDESIDYKEVNKALSKLVLKYFKSVRAYHCTRVFNIKPFQEQGLIKCSYEIQNNIAKSIFLNEKFPEITEEILKNALEKQNKCEDENKRFWPVYLDLSPKPSLKKPNHYLQYGNEFMNGVAGNLDSDLNANKYKKHLRNIGTSTIFTVELPLDLEFFPNIHKSSDELHEFESQAWMQLITSIRNLISQYVEYSDFNKDTNYAMEPICGISPRYIINYEQELK